MKNCQTKWLESMNFLLTIRFKTHHISSYACHICSDSSLTFKNSTKFSSSRTSCDFMMTFHKKFWKFIKITFSTIKKSWEFSKIFFFWGSNQLIREKSFFPWILLVCKLKCDNGKGNKKAGNAKLKVLLELK